MAEAAYQMLPSLPNEVPAFVPLNVLGQHFLPHHISSLSTSSNPGTRKGKEEQHRQMNEHLLTNLLPEIQLASLMG